MAKVNKVVRIALSGGIIGWLTTNPRRALDARIDKENQEGWNAIYILPHVDTNLVAFLARVVVLVLTLFLWTWGAGYLILFERERAD
ncbi:MAG: hypothetical protein OXU81_12940 [Gammaproteobacteria bacterium]|nr:hypothetical protein [Gammaproteobacteria bacterium]